MHQRHLYKNYSVVLQRVSPIRPQVHYALLHRLFVVFTISISARCTCVSLKARKQFVWFWVYCAKMVEYIREPEPSHIICIV